MFTLLNVYHSIPNAITEGVTEICNDLSVSPGDTIKEKSGAKKNPTILAKLRKETNVEKFIIGY